MRHLVIALVVMGACRGSHDEPSGLAATAAACTSGKDLACPRPILYVASLDASMKYYRDKLGFKIDWTDGKPADFGAVSRGEMQVFMCQGCQGHAGGWIWVMTPDVDKLYAELVKRGATIQEKPEDRPWGVREMRVADVDGNVLRVAAPLKKR